MDEARDAQVAASLHRLDHLIRAGRSLHQALLADPSSPSHLQAVASWQQQCAATIGQLSGGSKAHWLARAYGDAFLVAARADNGGVETEAGADRIIARILDVLGRAMKSIGEMGPAVPDTGVTPAGRRLDFVADAELRAQLEQAYVDRQEALARGDFAGALVGACSMLEAIVTEALLRRESVARTDATPVGPIVGWPFETRLAVAEQAGLISAGWKRLPARALSYRDLLDPTGDLREDATVPESDARVAGQVLNVILRDLAPGR